MLRSGWGILEGDETGAHLGVRGEPGMQSPPAEWNRSLSSSWGDLTLPSHVPEQPGRCRRDRWPAGDGLPVQLLRAPWSPCERSPCGLDFAGALVDS